MTLPANRRYRFALLVFSAWTVYCVLLTQQLYISRLYTEPRASWWEAFLECSAYVYFWALLTPLISFLGNKRPLAPPFSLRNTTIHFTVALILSFFSQCLTVMFLSHHDPVRYPVPNSATLFRTAFTMMDYGVMYWVILLIQQWLRSVTQRNAAQLRASELQTQLAGAQLQALKTQLHPHFLFNALNSVSELIHQDPETADRMVALISDLLRTFLQTAEAQEVRLEDEIEVIERYLEIQKIRFADRLNFRIDLPQYARDAMIPSLILQPLMENAVLHGIARRDKDGLIEIAARRENGLLHVSIVDNGDPAGATSPDQFVEGMGLRNTRRRLDGVYGSEYRFMMRKGEQGGIEAALTIPFRLENGGSNE